MATYERGVLEGTPLTFLHGYPSSSLDLAPVLDHLGAGWRVLTLDLPGFGAVVKHAAAGTREGRPRPGPNSGY